VHAILLFPTLTHADKGAPIQTLAMIFARVWNFVIGFQTDVSQLGRVIRGSMAWTAQIRCAQALTGEMRTDFVISKRRVAPISQFSKSACNSMVE
jgi:hypothetical protein